MGRSIKSDVVEVRRRTVVHGAIVATAAAAAWAPLPADGIERWFSTGLYPRLQHVLTPVSNLMPFAWLDVLLIIGVAAAMASVVRTARRAWLTRSAGVALHGIARIVIAAAIVYLMFLALWGLNYRRVPMAQRLVLDSGSPQNDAVAQLGLEAVSRLNALYSDAHAAGWPDDVRNDPALRTAFDNVQRALSDSEPAVPGRLKRSVFGPYFRWASVDGMTNPFGLEVIANPDLLPYEQPFVAAHEWAHLAGFANEAEANFVGWLTCIRADVPAQYSGWLYLFWQVSGEVNADARARLGKAVEKGPRADIDAVVERVREGQLPSLRNASWLLYDQYLKANRVEEGVRSYGEVINLILRARFDETRMPVRRAPSHSARGS
jgi:hypothetical protein